jgi:hypothetical protein
MNARHEDENVEIFPFWLTRPFYIEAKDGLRPIYLEGPTLSTI